MQNISRVGNSVGVKRKQKVKKNACVEEVRALLHACLYSCSACTSAPTICSFSSAPEDLHLFNANALFQFQTFFTPLQCLQPQKVLICAVLGHLSNANNDGTLCLHFFNGPNVCTFAALVLLQFQWTQTSRITLRPSCGRILRYPIASWIDTHAALRSLRKCGSSTPPKCHFLAACPQITPKQKGVDPSVVKDVVAPRSCESVSKRLAQLGRVGPGQHSHRQAIVVRASE